MTWNIHGRKSHGQPRLDVANIPQHVVQRGNDRQPCFFKPEDYERYLNDLRELSILEGCAVHAYVLMTNHVHLLMTPNDPGQVGRLMQALGRRYVRYVNDRYHRTGTLWEGRYKACLVDKDSYLLHCYRSIELNPIRARMSSDAGEYERSSYRCNAPRAFNSLIRPHPGYLSLGANSKDRFEAYKTLVDESLDSDQHDAIRAHLQRQHALGWDRFRIAIETLLNRRAGTANIGRPGKSTNDLKSAT